VVSWRERKGIGMVGKTRIMLVGVALGICVLIGLIALALMIAPAFLD
jgi:hypothetical protein